MACFVNEVAALPGGYRFEIGFVLRKLEKARVPTAGELGRSSFLWYRGLCREALGGQARRQLCQTPAFQELVRGLWRQEVEICFPPETNVTSGGKAWESLAATVAVGLPQGLDSC